MRVKKDIQLYLDYSDKSIVKVAKTYREKYDKISEILDANSRALAIIHEDIRKLSESSGKGRKATYTTENILRALIVHNMEETDWRGTVIRISESMFLRGFIRLGNRPVMDYSFLCKCFKAINPESWKKLNEELGQYALDQGKLDANELRADTTVIESNIHPPTDASLLWDVFKVMSRILTQIREVSPELCPHRFHFKKVRKRYLFISRYINSKVKKRKVKRIFSELIESVERVRKISEETLLMSKESTEVSILSLCEELSGFIPASKTVLEVSRRVNLNGEKVSSKEKIYSIFEQHVELLTRGKKEKKYEFGHKILLCQARSKFITDYDVMEHQRPDSELALEIVEKHKKLFGAYPEVMAADGGFRSEVKKMEELGAKIKTVAIPKRVSDWGNETLSEYQGFRAGIEGTISVLKRGFRLIKCYYKGFKSFASSIGMAVFCHNIVQLAK